MILDHRVLVFNNNLMGFLQISDVIEACNISIFVFGLNWLFVQALIIVFKKMFLG